MTKPNFKLPTTKQCIVRYVDKGGETQDILMDTPANNPQLLHTMLMTHKIGYGQIRAVKGFDGSTLTQAFQRNFQSQSRAHRDSSRGRFEPMFA